MPEHDKKATDCRLNTRSVSAAVAQGLNNDPQLHQPQQKVSILDDLVGEEASLSVVRGGARRSTLHVQVGPRHQQLFSQDSHILLSSSCICE